MNKKAITPLPPGCTEVDCPEDSTKKHYRCPALGWSINMELRRCSFHHRRAKLAAHIEKGNHIFDIPREKDKLFPEKLCIDNKIKSYDQVQHSIMRAIVILSSLLNISAKKAASSKMEDFVHFLLKLGIQLKTNYKKQTLDVEDIFSMPNINKLTDYIKIVANETTHNAIQYFKNKYTNFEMDSGIVSILRVIHYVISLTEDSNIKPFLYNLTENVNFDHLSYSKNTNLIITELFDKNIYISSIIVDNLKCQTKGLELMKSVSENPLINAIYIVHCFCHLTSLVFVNTLNNNSHLSQLVNSIKEIVTILRKTSSKSFIGKTCPTIVQTRWQYLHEILIFIQKFQNEIKTILIADGEDELLEKIPEILELIKIIKPLRYFCDNMEKKLLYMLCCSIH